MSKDKTNSAIKITDLNKNQYSVEIKEFVDTEDLFLIIIINIKTNQKVQKLLKTTEIEEVSLEIIKMIKTSFKDTMLEKEVLNDTPPFINEFKDFLIDIENNIKILLKNVKDNTLQYYLDCIYEGANGYFGIKKYIEEIGSSKNRNTLIKILEIKPNQLSSVSKEVFFHKFFMEKVFMDINEFIKIHAYKNIIFEDGHRVEDDFLNYFFQGEESMQLIDQVFEKIIIFFREKWNVDFIIPNIFKDSFLNKKNEYDPYEENISTFVSLNLEYRSQQNKLIKNKKIITDIFTVGIIANDFNFKKKPIVSYNL